MQSSIKPVTIFPAEADTLFLRGGSLGPPPSYYYALQQSVKPEKDGDPTTYVTLKDGNVSMTPEQWSKWGSGGDDDAYQLSAIAANLGLTLTS